MPINWFHFFSPPIFFSLPIILPRQVHQRENHGWIQRWWPSRRPHYPVLPAYQMAIATTIVIAVVTRNETNSHGTRQNIKNIRPVWPMWTDRRPRHGKWPLIRWPWSSPSTNQNRWQRPHAVNRPAKRAVSARATIREVRYRREAGNSQTRVSGKRNVQIRVFLF